VFREAGKQVSPVTMSRPSPRASAPPCLPLFIKGLLKEGWGLVLFLPLAFALEGFGALALDFALGFLVWETFGREKNY
jgi:hypothetical protein